MGFAQGKVSSSGILAFVPCPSKVPREASPACPSDHGPAMSHLVGVYLKQQLGTGEAESCSILLCLCDLLQRNKISVERAKERGGHPETLLCLLSSSSFLLWLSSSSMSGRVITLLSPWSRGCVTSLPFNHACNKGQERGFCTPFYTSGEDAPPPHLPTLSCWAKEIKIAALHPFSGQQAHLLPSMVPDCIPQTPTPPGFALATMSAQL